MTQRFSFTRHPLSITADDARTHYFRGGSRVVDGFVFYGARSRDGRLVAYWESTFLATLSFSGTERVPPSGEAYVRIRILTAPNRAPNLSALKPTNYDQGGIAIATGRIHALSFQILNSLDALRE